MSEGEGGEITDNEITDGEEETEEQPANEEQEATVEQEATEDALPTEVPETTEEPEEIKEQEGGGDLEQVAEENEKLLEELESENPTEDATLPDKAGELGKNLPESAALKGKIDDDTLKQLEEIEKEAKTAANTIYELKTRVQDLLRKSQMTSEESKELEQKNNELNAQMALFEEKTKQIQDLIANTNVLENMPERVPQAKHEEDVLPRMILLGIEDDYVPKIVVCDQKNKGVSSRYGCIPGCPGPSPAPFTPSFPLSMEKCGIQEKNSNLERMKSRLEEDIFNKDRTLQELQFKLANLQAEIRTVTTENATLNDKIRNIQQNQKFQQQQHQSQKRKQPCEPTKMCPGVIQAKLKEYSDYTRILERQLVDMERDFDNVHRELCAAQRERNRLRENYNGVGSSSCRKRCK